MSSFFLLRTGLPRISTFFPYTTLFRSHLGVGRAQRVDGESLGEGPAGVVVGILLRIVRGPVLIVEQRVGDARVRDRKSTRLNSSHLGISYAVFCLKKKNKYNMKIISTF